MTQTKKLLLLSAVLVAAILVAGCTSTVSTDYPSSGRSKLVEGAVGYLRDVYNTGYSNTKQKSFDVNWISNTQVKIHEESVSTQNYATIKKDYTITHFPSTAEASTYLGKSGLTYDASSSSLTTPIIDYYKITGKTPSFYKVFQTNLAGMKSISQFDSLIVEEESTVG